MADGTLKVGTITTSSGSGTITLGQSGETISVPSGATFSATAGTMSGQNYPAFEATVTTTQSLSDEADTKIQFPTERFDTDGAYDNSTNYRFTPQVAGKYFVHALVDLGSVTADNLLHAIAAVYKNGTAFQGAEFIANTNNATGISILVTAVVDLNGSTDYIEIYARNNVSSGSATTRFITSLGRKSYFGAYRIGA